LPDTPDDFNHFQSQEDTVLGMIFGMHGILGEREGIGNQTGNAVVTVPQQFNSQTVVTLKVRRRS